MAAVYPNPEMRTSLLEEATRLETAYTLRKEEETDAAQKELQAFLRFVGRSEDALRILHQQTGWFSLERTTFWGWLTQEIHTFMNQAHGHKSMISPANRRCGSHLGDRRPLHRHWPD